MLARIKCWVCFQPFPVEVSGPWNPATMEWLCRDYSMQCLECHAEAVRRIHEFDTPAAPEYEYTTPPKPPIQEFHPLGKGNRRIVRKSEPMAG